MKIPKSFILNGHEIKIKFLDALVSDEGEELMGEANHPRNTIKIARTIKDGKKKVKLPKSQIDHTACHEIIHQMLDKLGEHKLNNNEKFVDAMGSMLYQFLNTKKY